MAPLFLVLWALLHPVSAGHDYGQALSKSILFFEAQRSGYLPSNQRVKWRGHSGLNDGKISGVDLVGGYYDAGDNVKFGLPMAFTVTMMSWSVIEYGRQVGGSGELGHAIDAIKWGTDYFIKAHPQPYILYGEVGDGNTDHNCWQRPEDMTTSRAAYKIDPSHPCSDLAGETAAAMAAASIVFRRYNPSYSAELLKHGHQLFDFADKYRGKYDSSITIAQKCYRSISGYDDELLWAAAWLYKATNNKYYLNYLGDNGDSLGGTYWAMTEFGWDVKYAGVQTLVAKLLMAGKGGRYTSVFESYQEKAEFFMCSCLGKGTINAQRTPGGLIFRQRWNNMQFVTTATYLMTVYSDYLTSAGKSLKCASGYVDYILGDNPRATSYMVGYGNNFPRQVHHRASSIVSFKVDPSFVSCRGGYATWYKRKGNDPNLLTGAVVGGPDAYDNFADQRDDYEQTEPATYNNAPLLGVLARLHGGHSGYNQLLSVELPALKPIANIPTPAAKPFAIKQPCSRRTTSSFSDCRFIGQANWYNSKAYDIMDSQWSDLPQIFCNSHQQISQKLEESETRYLQALWSDMLAKSGSSYISPEWITSLAAGESLEFVYIHSASPAEVLVSSYTFV
ncbi:endoglucanase 6-like [Dorcoceras hygrometricum]|uniref:Endoglucanase n=1 Tax=Dorcoceras hygrometricum TaxID=472368 RepID=A0A2Z7BIK0_9LAMI|nr:endoglucanase 6-like [Dorcoceras hygrometricum]